jgi:hypothetical protein
MTTPKTDAIRRPITGLPSKVGSGQDVRPRNDLRGALCLAGWLERAAPCTESQDTDDDAYDTEYRADDTNDECGLRRLSCYCCNSFRV